MYFFSYSQEKNGQQIARNVSVTDTLSECSVQNMYALCLSKKLVMNQDTFLFRYRYQKIHAVPGLSAVSTVSVLYNGKYTIFISGNYSSNFSFSYTLH